MSWLEYEIEDEFRKSFQGKGKEDAVTLFIAAVISHDSAKRGDPVGQITVDGIALFLENTDCAFVLLLKSKRPVVTDSVMSADHKKAAVLEERVVVEVAMPRADLKICHWLHRNRCVDFSKTRIECGNLRIN